MFNLYTLCDAPEAWQIGIQDPASPAAEGMISFHNLLVLLISFIGVFVLWMLIYIVYYFNDKKNLVATKFTHSNMLEITWTIVPAILLYFASIPSFNLLYSLDEVLQPVLTMKIMGHQWYWTYEFSDFTKGGVEANVKFDSYMTPTSELTFGALRLLEVDNRVLLPSNVHIRLLVSAADVLHSWAVPSFGVKMDATPGRLSQIPVFIKRQGTFYGQCSEICGVNHGFMPIVIKSVDTNKFITWITNNIETVNTNQNTETLLATQGSNSIEVATEEVSTLYSIIPIIGNYFGWTNYLPSFTQIFRGGLYASSIKAVQYAWELPGDVYKLWYGPYECKGICRDFYTKTLADELALKKYREECYAQQFIDDPYPIEEPRSSNKGYTDWVGEPCGAVNLYSTYRVGVGKMSEARIYSRGSSDNSYFEQEYFRQHIRIRDFDVKYRMDKDLAMRVYKLREEAHQVFEKKMWEKILYKTGFIAFVACGFYFVGFGF
jgi:cytochrome c oxidase subunit 2